MAKKAKPKKKTAKKKPTPKKSAKKSPKKSSKTKSRKSAKKSVARKRTGKPAISHPGMMGDGTEEQNLNETGNPGARITEKEVDDAFKPSGSENG